MNVVVRDERGEAALDSGARRQTHVTEVMSRATFLFILSSTSWTRQQKAPEEFQMFRFFDVLFGCAHRHRTFPRTAKQPGTDSTTYVADRQRLHV